MKVRDYVKNTTNPFITNAMIDSEDPIRNTTFQSGLADFIRINHGGLNIRESIMLETEDEPANWIKWACSNLYIVNQYKYDHLYATTVAQYDPIENYRMVETEEGSNSGADSRSMTKGSQTNSSTNVKGQQTNTEQKEITLGERVDERDLTYGKGKQEIDTQFTEGGRETTVSQEQIDNGTKTTQYGATHDIDKREGIQSVDPSTGEINPNESTRQTVYEIPYDGAGQSLNNFARTITEDSAYRNERTGDIHTDTETNDLGRIDTTTTTGMQSFGGVEEKDVTHQENKAYSDTESGTVTQGEQENTEQNSYIEGQRSDTHTETEGQRSDSESGTTSGEYERELTRSGNIGVTTTQQMLESERQLAMFNLYAIVAKDIIGCIANRCYGGC